MLAVFVFFGRSFRSLRMVQSVLGPQLPVLGGKANGPNFGVLTSLAHYRPAPTHPRGIEPPNGGRTDVYLR